MGFRIPISITVALDPELMTLAREGIHLLRTIVPTVQELQDAQAANAAALQALADKVTTVIQPEFAALAKRVDDLVAAAGSGGKIDPADLQPLLDGLNASTAKLTDVGTTLQAAADAAAPEATGP